MARSAAAMPTSRPYPLGEGRRRSSSSGSTGDWTTVRVTGIEIGKVSWKEGTVDNEFMQRKSSKKCCVFHKEKPFDEDTSSDEEEDVAGGGHRRGCCWRSGEGSLVDRHN